jgi:hypothetical protein
MYRLLVETHVKHRFTDRDLRAKVAGDAAPLGLEIGRALLQHADTRPTAHAYRRKPGIV